MLTDAKNFRVRLASSTGLSDSAIDAAWPEWWSSAADASPSAQAELRFSLARKLGLDPRSLLDDESPRFLWDDSAKYKNFTGDAARDKPAITAFGMSMGSLLTKAVGANSSLEGMAAKDLRAALLNTFSFIRLTDLLGLLWGVGIPTIYLKVYPLAAKRMCAMTVKTTDRYAILLAKDSMYPASVAFHVAHEIGHIALGHVAAGSAVVDMDDPIERESGNDQEEIAADQFALELLTGNPKFTVEKQGRGRSAKELANQSMSIGLARNIEPGTLALCYGYATKEWQTVQAAMKLIYTEAIPAWSVTNKIAKSQLSWPELNDENASFLHAVMGGV